MSLGFVPSPESIAFRQKLAQLVSPLRPARVRVPFFRLAAHTVPTLRLYRHLLRHAPYDSIRWRIRVLMRKYQHFTDTKRTIKALRLGYKWLDAFQRAEAGNAKTRAILDRYNRIIEMKKEKTYWTRLVRKQVNEQKKLQSRPIITGGLLLPRHTNRALPRMKPQPLAITGMMRKRVKAKLNAVITQRQLVENVDLLQGERILEAQMMALPSAIPLKERENSSIYCGNIARSEWHDALRANWDYLNDGLKRDKARTTSPIPEKLLQQLKSAKKNKIHNKNRERARELSGEILPITIRRANQGPPAHVLSIMSETERKEDREMRQSISEVGYIGLLKKKHGWRIREGRQDGRKSAEERALNTRLGKTWSIEDGDWVSPDDIKRTEREYTKINEENERRRAAAMSNSESKLN